MGVDGQLTGVRVLDLGIWRPAPYAAQLLADLGADVIKVEPPGGDPMRMLPELFASLTSHKRPLVLDLKQAGDRDRALALAREADVVIEGFRPGVVDRLGVGAAAVRAVNPRAVYCSVSGYGQDGPLAQVPGHDINYQALSGMLFQLGPTASSVPLADVAAGLAAAFAICAALVRAARTGQGEHLDVAMADVLATWTGAIESHAMDGVAEQGDSAAGYGVYDVADGQVAIGIVTEDSFWQALCDTLGLEHLRDARVGDRFARQAELDDAVGRALATRSRDEVVAVLQAAGVPASPVLQRSEMLGLEHFRARRVVVGAAMGHPVTFAQAPARAPVAPLPPADDATWRPR